MREAFVRCGRAPLSICDRYDWLRPAPTSFFNSANQVLLGHLAVHAAQRAFDQAQVAKFFSQFHITICNYNIAICDVKNWICCGMNGLAGKAFHHAEVTENGWLDTRGSRYTSGRKS